MNMPFLLRTFQENANLVEGLTHGLTDAQARWKPSPDEWSVIEVLNHLYDEEREDFRPRLKLLLQDPQADWPPIDPQGWVSERAYNAETLKDSLGRFLSERQLSYLWLERLKNPQWDNRHTSPYGSMRAGDMLSAWISHDLLHIRQLVELRYHLLQQATTPYDGSYAGEW